jgi:hypothetical protein
MTFAGHKKRNRITAAAVVTLVLIAALASTLYFTRKPSSPNSILPDQFDYTLGIYPTNGTILHGCPTSTNVNITTVQGLSEAVTLTASGGPNGTVCDFTNQTGTPASNGVFTSNLTISTPSSTPEGTYVVNVTSTAANGKNYTASYALTVLNAEIQVSGSVTANQYSDMYPTEIKFIDTATNQAYSTYVLTTHGSKSTDGLVQTGTYSISLPNQHRYQVICSWAEFAFVAPPESGNSSAQGTFDGQSLTVDCGVGVNSITANYAD